MAVSQRGIDSSGRPILATDYMWAWFEGLVYRLGWRPTIVQGGWMARLGGGADASAGYHDGGGCLDLRVRDLTAEQVQALVVAVRVGGAGGWVRNATHGGMDPHLHLVLGTDEGLASGAAWQWDEYLMGRDGLASRGLDYHPRPAPMTTTPPKGWAMPTADEIARAVRDIEVDTKDGPQRLGRIVAKTYNRTLSADDLAAAVAKKLPGVPTANLRAAIAEVLAEASITIKEKP